MMHRTARKASERDRAINRTARTEYPEEQEIPYADGMISFKRGNLEPTMSGDQFKNERLEPTLSNERLKMRG
jgi:hypothetical protein